LADVVAALVVAPLADVVAANVALQLTVATASAAKAA